MPSGPGSLSTGSIEQTSASANVVIDTGRGEAGPVRRYRVHRDAVPR